MLSLALVLAVSGAFISYVFVQGEFYRSEDGLIFYSKPTQVNFYEALQLCYQQNMSLITPDTDERQSQIENLLKSTNISGRVWTAGIETEKLNFVWITTGNKINYNNWFRGEPSRVGTKHQCIGIYIDNWKSYSCTDNRTVLCEENRWAVTNKGDEEHQELQDCKRKLKACDSKHAMVESDHILSTEKKYQNDNMLNQLILANKSLELKEKEIDMLQRLHLREIEVLEDKLNFSVNLVGNQSKKPYKSYNFSFNNFYGNRN